MCMLVVTGTLTFLKYFYILPVTTTNSDYLLSKIMYVSIFLLSVVEELASSGEEVKEKPSLQQTKNDPGMY